MNMRPYILTMSNIMLTSVMIARRQRQRFASQNKDMPGNKTESDMPRLYRIIEVDEMPYQQAQRLQ